MATSTFDVIGRGVFSLAEASRLTRIPVQRIRRWLIGYTYPSSTGTRFSTPPVLGDYSAASDWRLSLSFADLIEVRFLDHFVESGVSWRTIRLVAPKAAALLRTDHPFSSLRFKTDGKTILAQIGTRDLLDLVREQYTLKRILAPYLYRGLDFGPKNTVARWWHEAGHHRVVIDPERSLGAPIVAKEGVPTQVLADAVRVEGAIGPVAAQFEVRKSSVAAAVEFEKRLAA